MYTLPRRTAPANCVIRFSQSRCSSDDGTGTGRWKVLTKIQQLLNTLKHPKRHQLPKFYEDDDIKLEIAATPNGPHAPHPEGDKMTPAVGKLLIVGAYDVFCTISHPVSDLFLCWRNNQCRNVVINSQILLYRQLQPEDYLQRIDHLYTSL